MLLFLLTSARHSQVKLFLSLSLKRQVSQGKSVSFYSSTSILLGNYYFFLLGRDFSLVCMFLILCQFKRCIPRSACHMTLTFSALWLASKMQAEYFNFPMKESISSTTYLLRSPPSHLWTGNPSGCLCYVRANPGTAEAWGAVLWSRTGLVSGLEQLWDGSQVTSGSCSWQRFSIGFLSSLCLRMALLLLMLIVLFFLTKFCHLSHCCSLSFHFFWNRWRLIFFSSFFSPFSSFFIL